MSAVRSGHPLALGTPPAWATSWGETRHGVWAGFSVGGVEHRMFWIPPGRFVMGSEAPPEWRYTQEPKHEVVITEGFWMAQTPCTQGLWTAVMGENPSRFVDPERPVEQVSWEDVQDFLQKLNLRVPGLEVRLPTEAQWEYACRAGTTTDTWAGDLDLLGDNNAPVLDDIAWYGGNSGDGYELAEGHDSRGWPEKQYPHEKAGTRKVGGTRPNPWGLNDMLGNVFEWCSDWLGDDSAELAIDPTGPEEGSERVMRGGSWHSFAWLVRAACRVAFHPSFRVGLVGFRLSRGPAPGPVEPGGARSGARAEPRVGTGRGGSKIAVVEPGGE